MGFFENKRKKIVITGTVCQICGMGFTATDRLVRHMTKAHGKVKRDSGTSCFKLLILDMHQTVCKMYVKP